MSRRKRWASLLSGHGGKTHALPHTTERTLTGIKVQCPFSLQI
jgi:hypothetical protein